MRKVLAFLIAAFFFLLPVMARGGESCPDGMVCVEKTDWDKVATVLREKQCMLDKAPQLSSDPIMIVVDKQGRIYGSGSSPKPLTLHLEWCNYDITATGQTTIVAAQYVEPDWGFRFRPKATVGILGTELLVGEPVKNAVDGGVLLEPFYFHFLNLNGYIGVRSTGVGLGLDVTRNFGVNMSYAITWGEWRSNPFVSVSFAFW